jgi:hypothetical protein
MQGNNFNFTIDDYEKSTNEFEKYVSTIPKRVPLKLAKMNTISSLVKDFIQKSQFSDTEELCVLTSIFNSVQNWTSSQKQGNSEKLISLALRHDELVKQQKDILLKVENLNQEVEEMLARTNGFRNLEEIEEVLRLLRAKMAKSSSRDQEKISMQISELKELVPLVRKIEGLVEKLEVFEREKEIIEQYIEQTATLYEQTLKKTE